MNLFFSIEQWWEAIDREWPWPNRRRVPVAYEPDTMAALLPRLATTWGRRLPEAWPVEHQGRVLWRLMQRGYEAHGVDAPRRVARSRGEAPRYVVASPDGGHCWDEWEAPDGVTGMLWPPPTP